MKYFARLLLLLFCPLLFLTLGKAKAQKTPRGLDIFLSKNEIGGSLFDLRTTTIGLVNQSWIALSPLNGIYYTRYFKHGLSLTSYLEGAVSLSMKDCSRCLGLQEDQIVHVNYSLIEYLSYVPFSERSKLFYPEFSFGWLVSNEISHPGHRDKESRILKSIAPISAPPVRTDSWNTAAVIKLGVLMIPTSSHLRIRLNTSYRMGYSLVSRNTSIGMTIPNVWRPEKRSFGDFHQWNLINVGVGYRF